MTYDAKLFPPGASSAPSDNVVIGNGDTLPITQFDSLSDLRCTKTSGFVHQHLASSVGIDTKSYVVLKQLTLELGVREMQAMVKKYQQRFRKAPGAAPTASPPTATVIHHEAALVHLNTKGSVLRFRPSHNQSPGEHRRRNHHQNPN
ncbi:hypothetical protein ACFX1S_040220 [Malus domestica]